MNAKQEILEICVQLEDRIGTLYEPIARIREILSKHTLEPITGPNVHMLKTLPEYWDAVYTGRKLFEVRRNDRDFKVGDFVDLVRFKNDRSMETGPVIRLRIGYILPGGQFGLEEGFCVLQLQRA